MALNPLFRRALPLNALRQAIQIQQSAMSSGPIAPAISWDKIGNREVVGYGLNGEPQYEDRVDVPFPGVRFKEVTPDIQVLREKEKGDWKKLTIEEKKALYRASFRQTLAEVKAPSGEWKVVLGYSMIFISSAIWLFILMKLFVYPPLPHTFDPEYQKAQLKRMIDLRMNPIGGLASKYDYEKGKWKE